MYYCKYPQQPQSRSATFQFLHFQWLPVFLLHQNAFHSLPLKQNQPGRYFWESSPFICDNSRWQWQLIKPGLSNPLKISIPSPASFSSTISTMTPSVSVIKTRVARQYFIPGKNMVCCKFSVQNDWLIYCKFAAASSLMNSLGKMQCKGMSAVRAIN